MLLHEVDFADRNFSEFSKYVFCSSFLLTRVESTLLPQPTSWPPKHPQQASRQQAKAFRHFARQSELLVSRSIPSAKNPMSPVFFTSNRFLHMGPSFNTFDHVSLQIDAASRVPYVLQQSLASLSFCSYISQRHVQIHLRASPYRCGFDTSHVAMSVDHPCDFHRRVPSSSWTTAPSTPPRWYG